MFSGILMILLCGVGVYYTVGTGCVQLRRFPSMFTRTFGSMGRKRTGGGVSPFAALSTALASTVGTGNIAGVATALVAGGPGAVFWMWVSALLGMATKFGEVALAVHFRERDGKGGYRGGPMYYIEKGLGRRWRPLALVFAGAGTVCALGVGNVTQSHSLAYALEGAFGIPAMVSGAAVMVLAGLVIWGGLESISDISARLVPLMSVLYTVGTVIVLIYHRENIWPALQSIFDAAFHGRAAAGGAAGYTVAGAVRLGIARGVFSNEAGLGSAPMAHAGAQTNSPFDQGLWGALEVLIDTLVMCTLTALCILSSGVFGQGYQGAVMTGAAFATVFGPAGEGLVATALALFGFSTVVGWCYYGQVCVGYLSQSPLVLTVYRAAYLGMVLACVRLDIGTVWAAADTLNACMAVPNLVALVGLAPVAFRLSRDGKRLQDTL